MPGLGGGGNSTGASMMEVKISRVLNEVVCKMVASFSFSQNKFKASI